MSNPTPLHLQNYVAINREVKDVEYNHTVNFSI